MPSLIPFFHANPFLLGKREALRGGRPVQATSRRIGWGRALRNIGLILAAALTILSAPQPASAAGSVANARSSVLPPRLLVGVVVDGDPLEGVKDGRLVGFSGEVLRHLFANSGTVLEARVFRRRDQMLTAACEGKLDIVMDAVPRNAFSECLLYSAPYLERASVVVARKDGSPQALSADLSSASKVALEAGSPWAGELRRHYPGIAITEEESIPLALQTLASGKADIYIGTGPQVQKVLREKRFEGLRRLRRIDSEAAAFRFAVPARNGAVLREIDQRLAVLPDSVTEKLRDAWLRNEEASGAMMLTLSPAEREAVLSHPVIRYAVPVRLPPYADEDSHGQLSGMTADYLSYLGKSLGIEFRYTPTKDTADAYERLARGEIDMLAGPAGKHSASSLLSGGVLDRAPMVIVTQSNAPYASGLKDIARKRVVVVRGSPMEQSVSDRLPEAHLVLVNSLAEGLELLRSNQADAMLGNLATMDTVLRGHEMRELRIAGSAGLDEEFGLRLVPQLEPLARVLESSLSSMPDLERERIARKWTSVTYRVDVPWQAAVERIWPLLALVGLLTLVLAASYLRLRQQIALRLQTEERLEDELAFQEALLASLPEPVAARNANRCYVDLNPAFERFFGVRREDIVGHGVKSVDAAPADSMRALLALQDEAVAAMEARNAQVEIYNAAGELRTVIFWVVPFRKRDGSPGGTVTTHMDITEVHQARQRALAVERQLKDVTDSLPVVVFQSRRSPLEPWGTIVYAAGDGEGTIGRNTSALLGRSAPLSELLRPEDLSRMREAIAHAEASHSPVEFEARLSAPQDDRWVQLRAVSRREGNDLFWNGVISDITERRRQADALREAKEAAEAALRAKEGFLAMMSHEIRTPMNGVLGLVELLENTLLTTDQRRMLALAKESGTGLAQILDDILDYAKIEAGRLTIIPGPLDLRELFDSVVSLLLPQARKKGVQLRLAVASDVPATIHADGIRLRQILFNLFGNAIKFTDRGSVTLRASVETAENQAAVIVINVEDTGIGIPKKDIQRLFAPFVQSERSSTRRFGGTGLGLTISRQLAELMHGDLTLESEEGIGTCATLRFSSSVLCQTYNLPRFAGRTAVIHARSAAVAESVAACASAAGMQVSTKVPEVSAKSGKFIIFSDADEGLVRAHGDHVIRLTDVPKEIGFSSDAGRVTLSINPLSWTAFLSAVEALQGQNEDALDARQQQWPLAEARQVARRILVVEDHPINREVIRQQLQLLGYTSTMVENGKEALLALQDGRFDLVLTDCHMPEIDGFELTRAIRSSSIAAVRTMPVVGITATTVREEHLRCIEVGMQTVVLKPTTLAALQDALARALGDEVDSSATKQASPHALPGEDPTAHTIDVGQIVEMLGPMLASEQGRKTLVQSLRDDRADLVGCLASGSRPQLRNWCHKVGGALSMLGQPTVNEAMNRFSGVVRKEGKAQINRAATHVLSLLDYLILNFERVCGEQGSSQLPA